MCKAQQKYHVLKCVKNYVCECIGVFDDRDEADKFREQKEKEVTDENVLICVYPLKISD